MLRRVVVAGAAARHSGLGVSREWRRLLMSYEHIKRSKGRAPSPEIDGWPPAHKRIKQSRPSMDRPGSPPTGDRDTPFFLTESSVSLARAQPNDNNNNQSLSLSVSVSLSQHCTCSSQAPAPPPRAEMAAVLFQLVVVGAQLFSFLSRRLFLSTRKCVQTNLLHYARLPLSTLSSHLESRSVDGSSRAWQ